MLHLLKEYVGGKPIVKCGATVGRDQVTAWSSDVTCPACATEPAVKASRAARRE